jgi:hypothetical protein
MSDDFSLVFLGREAEPREQCVTRQEPCNEENEEKILMTGDWLLSFGFSGTGGGASGAVHYRAGAL